SPKSTRMSLDDRTANRQSHSHPICFRCEEGLEDSVDVFWIDARSGVFDRHKYVAGGLEFRRDYQDPCAIGHLAHCVCGVSDKIQDDLLQLASIALYEGKPPCKIGPHKNVLCLQLAAEEREHAADDLVEIDRQSFLFVLFEHRADASDHFSGSVSIVDYAFERSTRFLDVGRGSCKRAQASVGICDHSGQWLVDFMSNGG